MSDNYRIFGRENIEQEAIDQFLGAMAQEYVVRGALMPDAHFGYSLPIGGVVATDSAHVVPAWVGYDIGCGMLAVPTTFDAGAVRVEARKIHAAILDRVPVGKTKRSVPLDPLWPDTPYMTPTAEEIFHKRGGFYQMGTLGGGNHFIEVGFGQDHRVWVVIHCGSRGVGHGIASHYMRVASGTGKASEGHFPLSTNSPDGEAYMIDQAYCLQFALYNRLAIAEAVADAIRTRVHGKLERFQLINRNHNHADQSGGLLIHRKGATHAELDMMGVIPGTMQHGSYIVRGLGNPDSLCSSSHGAGRVLSRRQAKEQVPLEAFQESMAGIVAQVGEETLDESPFAYKNPDTVMAAQSDLVEIVDHITPILNVKG